MLHLLWFFAFLAVIYINRLLYFENLYLKAQLRIYQKQLHKENKRLQIPEWFRRLCVWTYRLVWFGCLEWYQFIHIVKPEAVINWHRYRYQDWWTWKCRHTRTVGRPPLTPDEIALIIKLGKENPTWEPAQIAGQFYQLTGRKIHRDTVRKYYPKRNPDPLKALSWQQFLKLHMSDISAMDFFAIYRYGKSPLIGFFVIKHNRRELLHISVTAHPTAEWIRQQILLAFGENENIKYLISDNDQLFKNVWNYVRDILDICSVRTQLASPWQNGVAERFVRTLRYDLLQFIIPYSECMVRQRLQEYKVFYNEVRTHTTINKERPVQLPISIPTGKKKLVSTPLLGGLHHFYEWKEVA